MYTDSISQVLSGLEQGVVSREEFEALNKALASGAGYAGRPSDLVSGGVLQMESLDSVLKSVTFEMRDLKLWPRISMGTAKNTIEQYNRVIGYGDDSSPYIAEGGAGQEIDGTYIRDMQRIAFFSKRGKITDVMTLVETSAGDITALKTKQVTMGLLQNVERELYWGHSHFCDASGQQTGSNADIPFDSVQMSGLMQLILKGDSDSQFLSRDFQGWGAENNSVKRDLDGQVLIQDAVEDATVIAADNFGHPTELHAEPKVISAFVKQFYIMFRTQPGLSNQTVGYDVSKVQTSVGSIDLTSNVFLRPRELVRPSAVNAQCPSVAGATVAGTPSGSGSKNVAGPVVYAVTFCNDFGESAPIFTSSVTIADGEIVTLALTSAPAHKYIKVYKGPSQASAKFIGNYKAGQAVVDAGAKKPGLGEAFLLDMSPETMEFKTLLNLKKMNLARVTTAFEFLILLYGAMFCYKPKANIVFVNAGK